MTHRIKVAKCCPMRITFCRMQRNFVISSNANGSHGLKNIAHRAGKIGAYTIHFDLQRFKLTSIISNKNYIHSSLH